MDLLVRHTERHERKERGDEPLDTTRKTERKRAGSASAQGSAPPPGSRPYDGAPGGAHSSASVYAADQNQAMQQSIFNTLPGSNVNMPSMPTFAMLQQSDLNVHTPSSATYSTLSPHALSTHSGSPAENAFSAPPTASSSMPSGPSPPGVFASSLVIPADFAGRTPDGSMSGISPQAHPPHHQLHAAQQQQQQQHQQHQQAQAQAVAQAQAQAQAQSHHSTPGALSLVDQALAAGHALASSSVPHHPQPPTIVPNHSPFAYNAQQPLPPTMQHDFEEPFNFLSSSYGAPFASNNDYSWLFAPDQSFDVHFAASRPASPSAGGGSEFLSGMSGMYGGTGLGGTQTPARLAAVANALHAHGAISNQLDKVSRQLEATVSQQQQQQAQHQPHPQLQHQQHLQQQPQHSPPMDMLGLHHPQPHHHARQPSPAKLEPVQEEERSPIQDSVRPSLTPLHLLRPRPDPALPSTGPERLQRRQRRRARPERPDHLRRRHDSHPGPRLPRRAWTSPCSAIAERTAC